MKKTLAIIAIVAFSFVAGIQAPALAAKRLTVKVVAPYMIDFSSSQRWTVSIYASPGAKGLNCSFWVASGPANGQGFGPSYLKLNQKGVGSFKFSGQEIASNAWNNKFVWAGICGNGVYQGKISPQTITAG